VSQGQQVDQWWKIAAYNCEPRYVYGTAEQAEQFVAFMNRDREINLYAADPLADADLIDAFDSLARSDGVSLDSELSDIAERYGIAYCPNCRIYVEPEADAIGGGCHCPHDGTTL
jgi:hypothetical protein